ncbi:hypothetical protein KR059_009491 [Drosophila kikkawai]|nr:hypothetical protein KR059_009491 [Drosophila kikkawai]
MPNEFRGQKIWPKEEEEKRPAALDLSEMLLLLGGCCCCCCCWQGSWPGFCSSIFISISISISSSHLLLQLQLNIQIYTKHLQVLVEQLCAACLPTTNYVSTAAQAETDEESSLHRIHPSGRGCCCCCCCIIYPQKTLPSSSSSP